MSDENLSFPARIDAFELEMRYTELLIEILYILPPRHEDTEKLMEDLHTRMLKMRQAYADLRPTLFDVAT